MSAIRIAIVDDDPVYLQLLELRLESMGYAQVSAYETPDVCEPATELESEELIIAAIAAAIDIDSNIVGRFTSFTHDLQVSFSERIDILIAVERCLFGTSEGFFPIGMDSVEEIVGYVRKQESGVRSQKKKGKEERDHNNQTQ